MATGSRNNFIFKYNSGKQCSEAKYDDSGDFEKVSAL